MKNGYIGLVLATALFVCGEAKDLSSRFEMSCSFVERIEKGTVGRVKIPSVFFDQARTFPSDLRVMDEDGTQWPFFIFTPVEQTVSRKQELQILNKVFVGGRDPHWEMDLIVPESAALAVHNEIEIQTSGNDFIRRVELFIDVAHLATGYVFSHSSSGRSSGSQLISYPKSDVSRLRLFVYTSAKNINEQFEVQRVAASFVKKAQVDREEVVVVDSTVQDQAEDSRIQQFTIDIGFQNRPIDFIGFDVSDQSFIRSVAVYGRNQENESWRNVGYGSLHRYGVSESTTIPVRGLHRWLKIEIRRDDNQPLDLKTIRLAAVPRYLVFEAVTDQSARLCFRGWDVSAPAYDLKKRVHSESVQTLPLYELDAMEANPQSKSPSTLRRYSKLFSAIAIGAVSLLVVWIIISMMRRPPMDGE